MTVREILQWPDARLLRVAEQVDPETIAEDVGLYELSRDLIETCAASRGLGLSANQIGDPRAMFVMAVGARPDGSFSYTVVINPSITVASGAEMAPEGCLSFLNGSVSAWCSSPSEVVLHGYNLDGEPVVEQLRANGPARIAAHETDHLNGRTMLDRMSKLERRMFLKKLEKAKRRAAA